MNRFKQFTAVFLSAAIMMTNFNVPVYAQEMEEIVVGQENFVETEESVETENSLETGVMEAPAKGAGNNSERTYVEVHNMDELQRAIVSALDGKETTIKLETPYGMENDINQYYVSGNLVIPEKKNIVIVPNGQALVYNPSGVSCNAAEPFKLIIKKGASLSIYKDPGIKAEISVENHGTFINSGFDIYPAYGYAVKTCKGAKTILEEGSIFAGENTYALYNEGETIVNIAGIYSLNSKDKGAVYNIGNLTFENGYIEAADPVSVNGIDNIGKDAVLSIRGGYNIENCQGILNIGGTVEIGEEGNGTEITGIRTLDGGSVIMKAGRVFSVITAARMADSSYSDVKDGTFTMIGGSVGTIIYDENVPELRFGTVGKDPRFGNFFQYKTPIVKISENGADPAPNLTDYKFKALSNEGNELIEKCVYKEDVNGTIDYEGKKYIAASRIVDGELEFTEAPAEVKSISTNEAFLEAVKKGGTYRITNELYISENIVIEKDLRLSGRDIHLRSDPSEGTPVKLTSMTVAEGVCFYSTADLCQYCDSYGLPIREPMVTNHGTINDIRIEQELNFLGKDHSKAIALENNGYVDYCEVVQRSGGIKENNSIGIMNNEKGDIDYADVANYFSYNRGVKNAGHIAELHAWGDSKTREVPLVENQKTGKIGDIRIRSRQSGIVIDNAGELVKDDFYDIDIWNGTAVRNSGKFELYHGEIDADYHGIAVENSGTFVMHGGFVYNSSDKSEKSYAITYTEGHEPVLIGGRVYGTRYYYNSSKKQYECAGAISTNAAEGSAIVKMNGETAERGYYKNIDENTLIDSCNAARIVDGNIRYDSKIETKANRQYALLEKGESVSALSIFSGNADSFLGSSYVFFSNDEKVVTCSEVSGNEIFTAVGVGRTTVMVSCNETKDTDYATIEVVEEGGRAKLVADHYEANLLVEDDVMNANQKQKKIYFDWHLKENPTAAENYFNWNDNFKPVELIISGKSVEEDNDFNYYFGSDQYPVNFDPNTKQYYVTLTSRIDSTGSVTYLSRDEKNEFRNLNVKLIVKNAASGKTLEISVIQFLNLAIDQSEPSVQFEPVELNGAYKEDADICCYYNGRIHQHCHPNRIDCATVQSYIKGENAANLSKIEFMSYPKGFEGNGNTLSYVGPAKNVRKNIPVKVELENYLGKFDAVVPVSVKTVYPKVSLNVKSVTVPDKESHMEDMKLSLIDTKSPLGIRAAKKVEVVGNSNFEIRKYSHYVDTNVYYNEKPKYYYNHGYFYLQPRNDLKKTETVTLRVTYDNLNKKAGKEYSTILKLKVKPVSEKKFRMKAINKPILFISENAAGNGVIGSTCTISFNFTPSNYTNGYVRVTTSANNLTVTNGESRNELCVKVNKNTKIVSGK